MIVVWKEARKESEKRLLRLDQRTVRCHSQTLRLTPTAMPQQNPESNFRSNLSQFRWAQGNTNDSQQQQPSGNPFSRFYNSVAGDYVPLRSNDRSNEEEAWFALSRWER